MDIHLIRRFSPHIFFAKNEVCFPISADLFLEQCNIMRRSDPSVSIPASNIACYDKYKEGKSNVYLDFKSSDWKEKLRGSPNSTTCYARVIPQSEGYLIVYFYLFSHTDPELCCGCGFPFTKWSHKADLKFIAVDITETEDEFKVKRVYFGAHGCKGGEWRDANNILFNGGHPVAFSTLYDHSFYPEAGNHWRIFFFVNDLTEEAIFSMPEPIQVYSPKDSFFDKETMGWVSLPGTMAENGINSPINQWWFDGNITEDSNSWWKRLFCPSYF